MPLLNVFTGKLECQSMVCGLKVYVRPEDVPNEEDLRSKFLKQANFLVAFQVTVNAVKVVGRNVDIFLPFVQLLDSTSHPYADVIYY